LKVGVELAITRRQNGTIRSSSGWDSSPIRPTCTLINLQAQHGDEDGACRTLDDMLEMGCASIPQSLELF